MALRGTDWDTWKTAAESADHRRASRRTGRGVLWEPNRAPAADFGRAVGARPVQVFSVMRSAPCAMANGESASGARPPAGPGKPRARRRTRASSRSAASRSGGFAASTRRSRSRRRRSSRTAPSTLPRSRSTQQPTLHEHMRHMHPTLAGVLVELPPVLIAALGSEGIDSAADVAGLSPCRCLSGCAT
jgi:hypothetical protein